MPAMLRHFVGGTLTPDALWDVLVVERGFLSSPSGAADAYRTRPATLPANFAELADGSSPGAPVGKGYETVAVIQLSDAAGERVGPLGIGLFEGGGTEHHAEAEILRLLSATPTLRNGRMTVVVDTPVCPSCTKKLLAWARDAGLAGIDAYVPERQSMVSATVVRPKQASLTAAMANRPKVRLRPQHLGP